MVLVICVIVAVALFVLTAKGQSRIKWITNTIGVVFLVIGIAGFFLEHDMFDETGSTICIFAFTYGIAGLFLLGAGINLYNLFCCNVPIIGILTNINCMKNGIMASYTLTFSYWYHGIQYQRTTAETFGTAKVRKMVTGKEYPILISDRHPSQMVYKRKIGIGTICMIACSIGIMLVPIAYVNGVFMK